MRMSLDIDIVEHPALADIAEHLIGELFRVELLRRLRTVDGDHRPGGRHLVDLPHAHRPHTDHNDGDQRHPDSCEDSSSDWTRAHSITFRFRSQASRLAASPDLMPGRP